PTSGVRRVERPDASDGARVADSRLGWGQEGSRASAARTERLSARVRMGSEVAGSPGGVVGYGEWGGVHLGALPWDGPLDVERAGQADVAVEVAAKDVVAPAVVEAARHLAVLDPLAQLGG